MGSNTVYKIMGSHNVRSHWMYQYYVSYLAWWWLNEPKHVAELLILITNICCVKWLNKLLYYCRTQRDGSCQKHKSGRSWPIAKYRGNPSSGSRAADNTCGQTDGHREEHAEAKRRFPRLRRKRLKKGSSCLTGECVQGANSTKVNGSVPCKENTDLPSASHTRSTHTLKQSLYRSGQTPKSPGSGGSQNF